MKTESAALKKSVRELNVIKARMSKDRDKLRDLRDDISQIESDADQALQLLDDAIELLSQQL